MAHFGVIPFSEYRSFDGSGNNLLRTSLGRTRSVFLRRDVPRPTPVSILAISPRNISSRLSGSFSPSNNFVQPQPATLHLGDLWLLALLFIGRRSSVLLFERSNEILFIYLISTSFSSDDSNLAPKIAQPFSAYSAYSFCSFSRGVQSDLQAHSCPS